MPWIGFPVPKKTVEGHGFSHALSSRATEGDRRELRSCRAKARADNSPDLIRGHKWPRFHAAPRFASHTASRSLPRAKGQTLLSTLLGFVRFHRRLGCPVLVAFLRLGRGFSLGV